MPSDSRLTMVQAALARPVADFRAAVADALQRAEAWLALHAMSPDEQVARFRAELGPFAAGHIDSARFGAVFATRQDVPADVRARLEQALAVLRDVLARGDALFHATVPRGQSLAQVVGDGLAGAGRAFGAVLAVDLLRAGRFNAAEHDGLLDAFRFRDWTRTERRFAPPLIVAVDGADVDVSGLGGFLDGREKIVLVVDGACPPAPLVRLVTPGTLVLQTVAGDGLDRVATFDGPAVAAVMPAGAAEFLHDPRRGNEPWQRLEVRHMPAMPGKALHGVSAWQMGEDLRQLEALAAAPVGAPLPSGTGGAPDATDAVDRLASWLLHQSGLS